MNVAQVCVYCSNFGFDCDPKIIDIIEFIAFRLARGHRESKAEERDDNRPNPLPHRCPPDIRSSRRRIALIMPPHPARCGGRPIGGMGCAAQSDSFEFFAYSDGHRNDGSRSGPTSIRRSWTKASATGDGDLSASQTTPPRKHEDGTSISRTSNSPLVTQGPIGICWMPGHRRPG